MEGRNLSFMSFGDLAYQTQVDLALNDIVPNIVGGSPENVVRMIHDYNLSSQQYIVAYLIDTLSILNVTEESVTKCLMQIANSTRHTFINLAIADYLSWTSDSLKSEHIVDYEVIFKFAMDRYRSSLSRLAYLLLCLNGSRANRKDLLHEVSRLLGVTTDYRMVIRLLNSLDASWVKEMDAKNYVTSWIETSRRRFQSRAVMRALDLLTARLNPVVSQDSEH